MPLLLEQEILIALYNDAVETNVDTASDIAALFEGAGNTFALNGKAILITGDVSGVNDTANIWFIDSSLDSDSATVTAADVINVGQTNSAFDLDTLTTDNITFA
jgi:hypothetical protein